MTQEPCGEYIHHFIFELCSDYSPGMQNEWLKVRNRINCIESFFIMILMLNSIGAKSVSSFNKNQHLNLLVPLFKMLQRSRQFDNFFENHTLNFPKLGTYLTFWKKMCCQRVTTFCFVYHTTHTEKMTERVLHEGINEEVELQTFADQKRSSSTIFSSRVTKGSF